jgi:uncharacterized protein
MFALNLKPLLTAAPRQKTKLFWALIQAYRTGCKIAVVDQTGKFLETAVVYPTPPQKKKTEEAKRTLKRLIEHHKVTAISIGKGQLRKRRNYSLRN